MTLVCADRAVDGLSYRTPHNSQQQLDKVCVLNYSACALGGVRKSRARRTANAAAGCTRDRRIGWVPLAERGVCNPGLWPTTDAVIQRNSL
jgi:hypothetical protein